jgi:Domain of unknown function (DUF1841)
MPLFHEQSRADLRRVYVEAWRKYRAGEPLEPLQAQVARLIAEHPEYHELLEAEAPAVEAEFLPEGGAQNPFLHLGLHLAIREQVSTDRPAGIRAVHASLASQLGSAHQAEHRMLEILGEILWESQRSGAQPDEMVYLERLKKLGRG